MTLRPLAHVAVAAAALAGCGGTALSDDVAARDGDASYAVPDAPPGVVVRAGPQLLLDGRPFRFTGFVVYNANSLNNCGYTMGEGPALDDAFNVWGPGLSVLRASFFQYFVTIDGHRDWRAFDHTMESARAHGVRLIVVLDNQWYECSGWPTPEAGYHTEAWYRDDYRSLTGVPPGYPASYRDYVREVVTRYRNEPAVLMWELMGEPEAATVLHGACATTAGATLRAWAADMAQLVRSIDPLHLISLGTIGGPQCGTAGEDYAALMAVPELDVCQYHDYDPSAPLPWPRDLVNGLAPRVEQCAALGKPLVVAEAGVIPNQVGGTLAARAQVFSGKFDAQYGAGAAGVMVFTWRDAMHGGSALDAYEVGPDDPTLSLMQMWGARLSSSP